MTQCLKIAIVIAYIYFAEKEPGYGWNTVLQEEYNKTFMGYNQYEIVEIIKERALEVFSSFHIKESDIEIFINGTPIDKYDFGDEEETYWEEDNW